MEKFGEEPAQKIIDGLPQFEEIENLVEKVSGIGNRVKKMKNDYQMINSVLQTSPNMEEILKYLPRTMNLFGLKIRIRDVVEYFSIFITLFISIMSSFRIFFAPEMEISNTVLIVLVICSCVIIAFIYFNNRNLVEMKKLEMKKYDQKLTILKTHITDIANINSLAAENLINMLEGNKKIETKFNLLVSCLIDKFPPEQFEKFFNQSE